MVENRVLHNFVHVQCIYKVSIQWQQTCRSSQHRITNNFTLYDIVPNFNNLEEPSENIMGKGQSAVFSPFPMFSSFPKINLIYQ